MLEISTISGEISDCQYNQVKISTASKVQHCQGRCIPFLWPFRLLWCRGLHFSLMTAKPNCSVPALVSLGSASPLSCPGLHFLHSLPLAWFPGSLVLWAHGSMVHGKVLKFGSNLALWNHGFVWVHLPCPGASILLAGFLSQI